MKLRFETFEQAEAATEAARRCYEALVIRAAQNAGGKRPLSRLLGYDSPGTVHNAIVGGKFSAIRRIARAVHDMERPICSNPSDYPGRHPSGG